MPALASIIAHFLHKPHEIFEVFESASGPLRLIEIRDGVMERGPFRKRHRKTLYSQIIYLIKNEPAISKGSDGLYRRRETGSATKKSGS